MDGNTWKHHPNEPFVSLKVFLEVFCHSEEKDDEHRVQFKWIEID